MMNKGLELIEAARLFNLDETQIDVLLHPQSVIHGMVCYHDGSVMAQLGSPDMRIPIAHTLAWPERMATPSPRLDLAAVSRLEFEAPDLVRFPALRLARDALRAGGGTPAILNAANEVAVEAFLQRRIGFLDIVRYRRTGAGSARDAGRGDLGRRSSRSTRKRAAPPAHPPCACRRPRKFGPAMNRDLRPEPLR